VSALYFRGGAVDGGAGDVELLEVRGEQAGQLLALGVVQLFVRPGFARVEHLGGHAGAFGGDLEAEHGVLGELNLGELAVERGVEERAGVLDAHALAHAVRPAA